MRGEQRPQGGAGGPLGAAIAVAAPAQPGQAPGPAQVAVGQGEGQESAKRGAPTAFCGALADRAITPMRRAAEEDLAMVAVPDGPATSWG